MYGYGNSFFLTTRAILAESNAAVLPVNTVAPALSGTAQEGQTLTCSTGTWTGTPTITYSYQWKRNGSNIGSATNSTYTLVTADVSQSITCEVTATNAVGSANAISNTITPIAIGNLLLDMYTSSAVAYSLRKLRTAYTGASIRVRRSSDNAEQDINFVGNDLDTASLLTFCGAGNGFVTTWYDQSGNINHSTQSTAVNQAQIVSSGALILDSVTNKITTTWSNDRYNLTSGISTNTQYLSISMQRVVNSNDSMIHLGNSSSTITPMYLFGTGGFVYTVRSAMSTLFTHSSTSSLLGRNILTGLKNASNLKVAYINGVVLPFTSTEAPAVGTLNTFGQLSTLYTLGQYQEYIYWNSEQSANRTGIETNINTYWNAY